MAAFLFPLVMRGLTAIRAGYMSDPISEAEDEFQLAELSMATGILKNF